MNGINNVMLMGRLGADPKVFATKAGQTYCRFNIATNYMRKSENGEKSQATTWHKVTVFGKTAEACQTYLRKGSVAIVNGYLEHSKYTKDGIPMTATDVVARKVDFVSTTLGSKADPARAERIFSNQV